MRQPTPALTRQGGPNRNRHARTIMANKPLPTPDVLRQLLRYAPETGKLFWLPRGPEWFGPTGCVSWNARFAGQEAFTALDGGSAFHGFVLGAKCKAHRVIWALVTGEWPSDEIDHIDCDRKNNKWANLRSATRTQNQQNIRAHKDSASGARGLWQRPDGRWRVRIQANKVGHEIGISGCKTAAAIAYAKASAKLHGEFGRTA